MEAEILAVGSELLTPQRLDTNSLFLTRQLNRLGVEVTAKSVVGDDRERLRQAVALAVSRASIVILTGGLGPTEDDLTREAVAAALGRGLGESEALRRGLEERFARIGRKMAENNLRQAQLIEGAEALANERGTAPGQFVEAAGCIVILLPGPPHELEAMFQTQALPRLMERLPQRHLAARFYRVTGMGESDLDRLIAPVYTRMSQVKTTILSADGDLQVHLVHSGVDAAEAERLVASVAEPIEKLLGDKIYSRDGSPLEQVVGRMLLARGATLAVAESCTGGQLGQRLTSVAGSSAYVLGGFITYTDAVKSELVGVDPELIAAHTAVSEPVAAAMAVGAAARLRATYAISVTGYAGPDGGTDENPVGTVFVGLLGPDGVKVHRQRFPGDRVRVRNYATQTALNLLRLRLG